MRFETQSCLPRIVKTETGSIANLRGGLTSQQLQFFHGDYSALRKQG